MTTTAYDGLTTTVTNAKAQVITTTKNSQGAVVATQDALGSVTHFDYDPFGNLVQTIDPAGNRIQAVFDLRGRQIQLNDPDLGLRTYSYDVLGQVTQSQDAKGQITKFFYDRLGRLYRRIEPGMTSTFTYDTAANGIGKPATAVNTAGYSQSFSYDALGRPSATTETLEAGVSAAGAQTYDAYGRVATATATGGETLAYSYTALGYLYEVRNGATGGVLWRAEVMDATGVVTQERYGNNILTTRTIDPKRGTVTAIAGTAASSFTYDANGNQLTGEGRTLTWTAFDMPATITRGTATVAFAYGPGHQRIRQARPDATVHYFGGGQVERVTAAGGAVSWT
ncbi:hypothetical protein, partial [Zavarzinia sp.]|uniref:hypothetical protein n=1 Tax=Zavarzinia sp. TaxID=2027920 RepID=UPI0035626CCA